MVSCMWTHSQTHWVITLNMYSFCVRYTSIWTSLVAQMVKRLPTMRETQVQSLGREDLLEQEMATYSSILAWKAPWTEKPGSLQSMGSQSWTRLSNFTSTFTQDWSRYSKRVNREIRLNSGLGTHHRSLVAGSFNPVLSTNEKFSQWWHGSKVWVFFTSILSHSLFTGV